MRELSATMKFVITANGKNYFDPLFIGLFTLKLLPRHFAVFKSQFPGILQHKSQIFHHLQSLTSSFSLVYSWFPASCLLSAKSYVNEEKCKL